MDLVICQPKTEAVLVTIITTVPERRFEKQLPFAGNDWKVREEPPFFFPVRPHDRSLPLRRQCGTLESKKIIYRLSCLLAIDSSALEFLDPYLNSHLGSMGFLVFHYAVLESTNVLGRSFPTKFEFFQTGRQYEQDGKQYFPQAQLLCGEDLWRPLATRFLLKWPSLQAVQKAKPATLKTSYYINGSRSAKLLEQRLTLMSWL